MESGVLCARCGSEVGDLRYCVGRVGQSMILSKVAESVEISGEEVEAATLCVVAVVTCRCGAVVGKQYLATTREKAPMRGLVEVDTEAVTLPRIEFDRNGTKKVVEVLDQLFADIAQVSKDCYRVINDRRDCAKVAAALRTEQSQLNPFSL